MAEAYNCRLDTGNPSVSIGSVTINGIEQNPNCDGRIYSIEDEANDTAKLYKDRVLWENQAIQACKDNLSECSDEVMSLYVGRLKTALSHSQLRIDYRYGPPFVLVNGKIGIRVFSVNDKTSGLRQVREVLLPVKTKSIVDILNRFLQKSSLGNASALDASNDNQPAKSIIRTAQRTAKTQPARPAENTAAEPRSKKVASGESLSTILRTLNHKPNWSSQALYFVGADGAEVGVKIQKANLLWPGNIVTIDPSGQVRVQLQTKAQLDKVSTLA